MTYCHSPDAAAAAPFAGERVQEEDAEVRRRSKGKAAKRLEDEEEEKRSGRTGPFPFTDVAAGSD